MSLSRTFSPVLHFDDSDGPLSGGWLCTYIAGTNTPVATFRDGQGTLNPTQIQLDSRGECEVWLDAAIRYKFALYDSTKTTPIWIKDNITAPGVVVMPDTKEILVEHGEGISVSAVTVEGTTKYIVAIDQDFINEVRGKQKKLEAGIHVDITERPNQSTDVISSWNLDIEYATQPQQQSGSTLTIQPQNDVFTHYKMTTVDQIDTIQVIEPEPGLHSGDKTSCMALEIDLSDVVNTQGRETIGLQMVYHREEGHLEQILRPINRLGRPFEAMVGKKYLIEIIGKIYRISEVGCGTMYQADFSEDDPDSPNYIRNKPVVDQNYDKNSTNAQSGKAVREAISKSVQIVTDNSGQITMREGRLTLSDIEDFGISLQEVSPSSSGRVMGYLAPRPNGQNGKVFGVDEDGVPRWIDPPSPGSGLAAVTTDNTLEGDGTTDNPLSVVVDTGMDSSSENPVQNRAVTEALENKQDQLTEMTDEEVDELIDSLD